MIYNAVIFDFDGTVCDTGEGIKKSAQYALESYGIECPDWKELDFFIGPPLLVTFQERFGQSAADAEKLVQKYRERYTNIGVYESEPYDGIKDLLKRLRSYGIKIGIASSKPKKYVVELLDKFNLTKYFDSICAVSFNADCESKASIIHRCITEMDVTADKALMVGDRSYDIDGARENHIDGVGVLWGYGNKFEFIDCKAKYIAKTPVDVEAVAIGMYERCDSSQEIFDGHIIKMHLDNILLCDDTKAQRECVDHPGGVGVIAVTDEDEVIMVRQFRYPYKELIYEIPAGKLDGKENPLDAGKREFKEECGGEAEEYISLGEVYPTPGYTNEVIHLYWAKGLTFGEQHLDEGELLTVTKMKFDTLYKKVMNGEIKDAKTVIAALKLKELRNRE